MLNEQMWYKEGTHLGGALQKEGLACAEERTLWLEHIPGTATTTIQLLWLEYSEHKEV